MVAAADVEAGRAFVTLYLKRTDYDRQVADLGRAKGDDRQERTSRSVGISDEERPELNRISKMLGLTGDLGNMTGILRLFRDTARGSASAISSIGRAAAGAAGSLNPLRTALETSNQTISRGRSVFGQTSEALQVVGGGFRFFGKAVIAIPKLVGSAIGTIRKMPSAFSETANAAERAGDTATKALARKPGAGDNRKAAGAGSGVQVAAAAAVVNPALGAVVFAAGKAKTAISSITGAMSSVVSGIVKMAGRVAASIGRMVRRVVAGAVKIGKAIARMPGQLVSATSDALKRVGASLAKIGAITTGITGVIVGSATLAAKSWAAYGEKIRGVQNDLMRFNLTAEEASVIARVSELSGESMERIASDIRDGTRDFSRWRNELKQSGIMMSGAGLSAALALSRAYSSLKGAVMGLKGAIGAALGPTLTQSAELFTGMIRGVTRWVSANKPLIVQVFKIASAVGITAVAMTTLGGALAGVGAIMTPFTAVLAAIAGGLAIVEVRTGAGQSIWAAYGDSVRRVVGVVSQSLGKMLKFADRIIGGMKDAIIAGDLAGAVRIMWAAAKVAWFEALLEIDKMTSGTFGGILASLAAGKWAAAGEGAVNALKQAWSDGVDFLTGIWGKITVAAGAAWESIKESFGVMISELKDGLADLLDWISENVLSPIVEQTKKIPTVLGEVVTASTKGVELDLKVAAVAIRQSLLDEAAPDQESAIAAARKRGAAREAARDAATAKALAASLKAAREGTTKAEREAARVVKGKAAQKQTANQKDLDDAIAAAKAARDEFDRNKPRDEDFAVSQDVQSIVRFSGEALGLSVGRGDGPAEKTAKISAEQLKEL